MSLVLCVVSAVQTGETRRVEVEDAGALELGRAVQYALDRNRSLARSAQTVRGQQIGLRSARSTFSLRVRPDAAIGVSDSEETWQYGLAASRRFSWGTDIELGVGAASTDVDGETTDDASVTVSLEQPLFRNFGRLVQLEGVNDAQSGLRAALRSYERQKADTVVQVVDAFETIIRLVRQIEVDETAVERMGKLYRLTKARERQGRATRVDLLRVDLQRGQAEASLENSRERLFSARREFAELLGFPPETDFDLARPPVLQIPESLLENAVPIAFSNRLDYAQALDDYQGSQRDVRIAQRRRYPDLSLLGRYARLGEGDGFSEAFGLREEEWSVGLALGSEINFASDRAAIELAESSSASCRDTIGILEFVIAREVQQQLTAFRRAKLDLEISRRNVKLARDRTTLARRLFSAGRGDNFSVTDAEEALVKAEDSFLTSRADASVSSYRLLQTLGVLVEHPEELKPTQIKLES